MMNIHVNMHAPETNIMCPRMFGKLGVPNWESRHKTGNPNTKLGIQGAWDSMYSFKK